jgi:hypothetical protein
MTRVNSGLARAVLSAFYYIRGTLLFLSGVVGLHLSSREAEA